MWRISVIERTNIPITRSILHEWDHLLWKSKKQEKGKRRAFTEVCRRVSPIMSTNRVNVPVKAR
jgi:hypothetical protein